MTANTKQGDSGMRSRLRFLGEPDTIYKYNGEPLTKEDLHFLYVQGEKLSVSSIALLFDVEPLVVWQTLDKFHIGMRKEDLGYLRIAEEINEVNREKHVEKSQKSWESKKREEDDLLWKKAAEIYGKPKPEPRVEIINGKRYVDDDLVRLYNRRVREIYLQLKSNGVTKTKELNQTRSVDLSAMRLHRGLDMFKFSEKSGIPYKHVVYYEKTRGSVIPKEVSDRYIEVLNISKRELRKIKECLSGERKTMFEEESRDLPDAVKEYVFKRDGGRCTKCKTDKFIHFHHKDRFSDGGTHEAKNLTLLCVKCHALEHYGEKGFALLKAQAEKLLGGEINWAN
jgi:hypothetical protein